MSTGKKISLILILLAVIFIFMQFFPLIIWGINNNKDVNYESDWYGCGNLEADYNCEQYEGNKIRMAECMVSLDYKKAECIRNLALKLNDENICMGYNRFLDEKAQNGHKAYPFMYGPNCYELLAMQKKDERLCDLADFWEGACNLRARAVIAGDKEIFKCYNNIKGPKQPNRECFSDIAHKRGDFRICEMVPESTGPGDEEWIYGVEGCVINILEQKEKVEKSDCDKLIYEISRKACYEIV